MPETPDFKKLAHDIAATILSHRDDFVVTANAGYVEEQLRLVWNARGAADIAKIEADVSLEDVYVKNLDRALRSLDR